MISGKYIVANKRSLLLKIAFIFLSAALVSCGSSFHSGSPGVDTILKEGFIGTDVLQISLIVLPDAHVKGLVARRENARNKAENDFIDLLKKKIAEYRKTNMASCKAANEEILLNQAKDVIQHASKAAEFFKEDESFAVIVRISRKNIKEILECHKDEKSFNQKTGGKK